MRDYDFFGKAKRAYNNFIQSSPTMGSERTCALGRLNVTLVRMQKELKPVTVPAGGKEVRIIPGPLKLEQRTIEIAEGKHITDKQDEAYYNGRWHGTE